MDFMTLIKNPIEFFLYILLPGWLLLITLNLSSRFKKASKSFKEEYNVVGQPFDLLLFTSAIGCALYMLVYAFVYLLSILLVTYNSFVSPDIISQKGVLLFFSGFIGKMILLLTAFLFLLSLALKIIFSIKNTKIILKLKHIVGICILLFLVLLILSSAIISPTGPIKRYIFSTDIPFKFYSQSVCDDKKADSTFHLLNPLDRPIVLYTIKKDPELSSLPVQPKLPIVLGKMENILINISTERRSFSSGDQYLFFETSEGSFLIYFNCDGTTSNERPNG